MSTPTTTGAIAGPDSQWYFDALRAGRLDVPRCDDCGHWARPSVPSCPACGSRHLTPTPVGGRGVVVSAIIDHGAADAPRTLGLVELDEGPWIAAQIRGDAVAAGTPVTLTIDTFDDGEPVPAFEAGCQGVSA